MHLPERWGMLQFASGPVNATPAQYNIQWTVRAVAAAVYYAQHAWRHGPGKGVAYTDDIATLAAMAPPGALATAATSPSGCVQHIEVLLPAPGVFVARVVALVRRCRLKHFVTRVESAWFQCLIQ
jgi:hypothetical protein